MENNQRSYVLPASILIAAALVSGALIYNTGSKTATPGSGDDVQLAADVSEALGSAREDRIILGDPDAPVKIVEFGDFQCPFCGRFHKETGVQIRKEYIETGKANMVYVDLAFLGPESVQSAQATHCAGDQGQYWSYHDFLFNYLWDNYYAEGRNGENVGAFADDNLKKFAKDLGLDTGKFNQCLDSQKYADKVAAGRISAQAVLGQRLSTPSIFVGNQLIQGAQPYAVFKQAIEEELKK